MVHVTLAGQLARRVAVVDARLLKHGVVHHIRQQRRGGSPRRRRQRLLQCCGRGKLVEKRRLELFCQVVERPRQQLVARAGLIAGVGAVHALAVGRKLRRLQLALAEDRDELIVEIVRQRRASTVCGAVAARWLGFVRKGLGQLRVAQRHRFFSGISQGRRLLGRPARRGRHRRPVRPVELLVELGVGVVISHLHVERRRVLEAVCAAAAEVEHTAAHKNHKTRDSHGEAHG